ncbi:hypothetical protein [Actinoallomurus rhizosphaericola]|uniref:hypothetical protein n=1 Tax=Actinoallomurus rhizosphaericola TaxID=2952536 RepID=UPI00209013B3|nr:hypothetical protein [Actinoallomurus rhizosphaericola]MCO5992202.1 hypothetical protein [Actinoallomurus rhizosphaericola]
MQDVRDDGVAGVDLAGVDLAVLEEIQRRVPDILSDGIPAIGPGGDHARMPGMPYRIAGESPQRRT